MPSFQFFRSLNAMSRALRSMSVVAMVGFGMSGQSVAQIVTSPTPLTPPAGATIASGPTSTEAGVVNEAIFVLQEMSSRIATQLPEQLLASAEGVAIVPHYIRGAFVIGVAGGRGVLMVRDANRNWQAPEFMTIRGGSVGWQIGVQSTDLVLVFRSPQSLNNIRTGKITLGANASAAAGPIGRFASAATDTTAQAEILTYSRTRGLFAGVALDGASLQIDVPATQVFYQTANGGPGVMPPSAITLVEELTRLSTITIVAAPDPSAAFTPASGTGAQVSTIAVPEGGLRPLETEVITLLNNVDDQWKAFLALPANWENAPAIPTSEVNAILARYERVATNPEFANLRAMPSFDRALMLLRALAAQAPQRTTLALPPPPPK